MAAEAYFKYGGEPRFIFPTTLGPEKQTLSPVSSPSMDSLDTSQVPQGLATPSWVGQQGTGSLTISTLGRSVTGPEVILSGRHNGFCAYFSRLLRPLWNRRMVEEVVPQGVEQTKQVSCRDFVAVCPHGNRPMN